MNISGLLSQQAREQPDAVALADTWQGSQRRTTFRQLEQWSARLAGQLDLSGLQPGDRVLVLQPLAAELFATLGAVFRLGLVAVMFDPSCRRELLDRYCELSTPRALICSRRAHLLRFLSRALRRIPLKWSTGGRVPGARLLRNNPGDPSLFRMHHCTPDAPALLTFTSGSTGLPRIAVRSHGFLTAQHRAVQTCLDLRPGQIQLASLPTFILANLASGVTSILADTDLRHPDRLDAARIVHQLRVHAADRLLAGPTFCELLTQWCDANGVQLSRLTHIFTGGGPIAPRLLSRLRLAAPRAIVVLVYGATEAEPIARITSDEICPADQDRIWQGGGLPAGFPVRGIHLRIVKDPWPAGTGRLTEPQFGRLCLSPPAAGEIVVHGDHVLGAAVEGQIPDDKFLVDGVCWHRTGDAGRVDGQGRLWMLGRCAGRVTDRRGTLYPFQVEQPVLQLPCVRRAALAGAQSRRVLFIEPAGDVRDSDLSEMRRLTAFAEIDEIRCAAKIPMDPRHHAKVDYVALQSMIDTLAPVSSPR